MSLQEPMLSNQTVGFQNHTNKKPSESTSEVSATLLDHAQGPCLLALRESFLKNKSLLHKLGKY